MDICRQLGMMSEPYVKRIDGGYEVTGTITGSAGSSGYDWERESQEILTKIEKLTRWGFENNLDIKEVLLAFFTEEEILHAVEYAKELETRKSYTQALKDTLELNNKKNIQPVDNSIDYT